MNMIIVKHRHGDQLKNSSMKVCQILTLISGMLILMHLVQETLSKCFPTRGFIYENINRKLKFSTLMHDDFYR
jgi:hypothetical protein